MYFLYNVLLKAGTLLLLPLLPILLLCRPKYCRRLRDRLGFPKRRERDAFQTVARPRIWFHAASLGELSAVEPIAGALKERNPDIGIVVSTTTLTGLEQVKHKIPMASRALLLPLDYPGAVKRIMKMVEPNLLVLTETELWPNLIRQTKRLGIQLALVNGRLSQRSLRHYQWISRLISSMLKSFDLMAMQSEKDAERFKLLGANPQRLKVTGNVKFDTSSRSRRDDLRSELRLASSRPVWVAGSTRPGEEEIILQAFKEVQERIPNAVLILAPRHLERLREVEQLLVRQCTAFTYRSRVSKELLDFPVIILDNIGELAEIYGLAQVAFIGGSLVSLGGHNPLEPAMLGVPVLIGPHTDHFARPVEILLKSGGAQVITTAEELAAAVINMLSHPEEARQCGEQARQSVSAYQGAAGRTVDLLQKLLLIKQWAREERNWREESLKTNTESFASKETVSDDWFER
ncbi:3-deoxy-D-manno-octulosonic acid transferase [bacterium]|nr:3-deoxy-D-manno-octulosonic acid transferase [bacterium]